MLTAVLVVLACALAALALGWVYFRRFTLKRAPIGVFNLGDVGFMMGAIVLVPFLYLLLPRWAAAGLLTLQTGGLVYLVCEPVLRRRLLIWLAALACVGADLAANVIGGPSSLAFFAVNDLVLIVLAVGIACLWAQSGLKARNAAILGAFLIGYDFLATSRLPVMTDLVNHLAGLPFSPLFAWPVDAHGWVGLGLGDVLMATMFPLVLRKAYGRPAGRIGGALSLATLACVFVLPLPNPFPVMVFFGPLMIAQYGFWRRRAGAERTTRQYLLAEPL